MAGGPALLDEGFLAAQTGGDAALAAELTALLADRLAALPGALDDAEPEAVGPLAHALAGAAAGLGARRLDGAARRLEAAPGDAGARRALLETAAATLAVLRARAQSSAPARLTPGGRTP